MSRIVPRVHRRSRGRVILVYVIHTVQGLFYLEIVWSYLSMLCFLCDLFLDYLLICSAVTTGCWGSKLFLLSRWHGSCLCHFCHLSSLNLVMLLQERLRSIFPSCKPCSPLKFEGSITKRGDKDSRKNRCPLPRTPLTWWRFCLWRLSLSVGFISVLL